jgi:hypothetical protein
MEIGKWCIGSLGAFVRNSYGGRVGESAAVRGRDSSW